MPKKKAAKKTVARSNSPKFVIVRSNMAGVHFGEFVSRTGNEVTLKSARRLWSWKARTCSELAVSGTGIGSRVAVEVPEVVVFDVIELITATPEAASSIRGRGWET